MPGPPQARLAIFKGERSGSTWLARTLQLLAPRHAYITEEAIGGVRNVPGNLKLAHLRWCLVQPTMRLQELLSNCSDAGRPTARCYERAARPVTPRILGWSVDPTHHSPLAYAAALRPFPSVLVVAYLRSNLVKWAVSVLRGGLLRKSCGWNPSAQCAASHGRKRHAFPPSRVLRQIYRRQQVTQQVLSAASAASPRVWIVVYEALQTDLQGTLTALHRALGIELPAPRSTSAPSSSSSSSSSSPKLQLAKVTADNLSAVLAPESHAALERELRPRPCLLAQLMATVPTPFPLLQCSVDYPPNDAGAVASAGRPLFVGTTDLRPIG